MRALARRLWPMGGALLFALLVAAVVDRRAPWPAADVSRGGEDAFAQGLHPRELPPRGRPQRWTTEWARVRFRHVPVGPATLVVRVRGQRGPVTVAADGVVLGSLAPGTAEGRWELAPVHERTRVVELIAEPFVAGGRRLGVLLERVELSHARGGAPALGLLLAFAFPGVVVAAAGLASGMRKAGAMGAAWVSTLAQAALLWPQGIVRSDYTLALACLLGVGAVAALGFARYVERTHESSGRWAYPAVLAAVLMQGLLATSPAMVVSDAVFHGNNLVRVAQGQWLLTSVTQHASPIRFPYGVSFYAPLIPLWLAGLDAVTVVRAAAAVSAVAASAALFLIALPAGAVEAALAVALWQLLPGTVDVFSYGNLSNVFGQALTVGFVAWWLRGQRWPVGAGLLAVGCLAHFSSLVVLTTLALLSLAFDGEGERRSARRKAVIAGLGLAAAYYVCFLPLMVEQLGRLAPHAGQGMGGLVTAARHQVSAVVGQWGLPVIALAVVGLGIRRVPEVLRGWWWTGAGLAILAIVSPVEVRYLYAVGPAVAMAAAAGAASACRRGAGRWLAGAVLVAQALLSARNALEAMLWRYRP